MSVATKFRHTDFLGQPNFNGEVCRLKPSLWKQVKREKHEAVESQKSSTSPSSNPGFGFGL